jgi:MFS family permease
MGSAEALRQGAFWVLTGALALALLASTAVAAHQVAYLIGRGNGPELAATVAGLVGLASLPGRWFLNRLADRVSPQKLLGGSLVAQAGGIALLIQATSVGWLAAYVLVFGGAFGAISPLRAAVMAQRFGRRSYGAIVAAQGVPVAVCAAAGPVLAGRLYDALGDYGAALWLCAGSALVAGAAVLLMPEAVAKRQNRLSGG